MVREFVIICLILIIIFIGNFTVINTLKDSTEILVSKIDEINENINDSEKAKSLIGELDEKWHEVNKEWAIIVTHQELDQIEISLLSAKAALENEDIDDAIIELAKLDFLLHHINEKEEFLLKNIF